MTFDPNNISLTPNDWFCQNIVYEGRGRAEFKEPNGFVEGPAVVRFDEYGESSAEMTVEKLSTDQPLQFGSMEFFSGDKPIKEDGVVSLPLTFNTNRCTKLAVITPAGEFSSTEGIHYGQSITIIGNKPETINFHLVRSQFQSNKKGPVGYWVFPLANFISDFRQWHSELDRHPLRIFTTPVVPDGLTGKEAFVAVHNANVKNRLIIFEFNGGLGFIERLADYEARKDNLLNGKERYAVTAIMVGEVSDHSIEFADLDDWLPSEFLRLLSLASGSVVSAPWIEFRDYTRETHQTNSCVVGGFVLFQRPARHPRRDSHRCRLSAHALS
jgi:hypothetical protein